jgi:hypothetical protein
MRWPSGLDESRIPVSRGPSIHQKTTLRGGVWKAILYTRILWSEH